MELRLLSADVDDLVDPDVDTIRGVLTKLPELSGDKPPRAVLVHDNGKDFVQFFAVFGKEITTGRPTESCHLQYCEHHEGKPSCFYSEEADFQQAVTVLLAYAKNHDWKEAVAWERFKYETEWQVIVFGLVLTLLGIFASYNFLINGKGKAIVGALFSFGIVGLLIYSVVKDRGDHGKPWTSGEGSCTSGEGGSNGGDGGGRGQGYEESGGEQISPEAPPPPPD